MGIYDNFEDLKEYLKTRLIVGLIAAVVIVIIYFISLLIG